MNALIAKSRIGSLQRGGKWPGQELTEGPVAHGGVEFGRRVGRYRQRTGLRQQIWIASTDAP